MNPVAAKATLARLLRFYGEDVTIMRYSGRAQARIVAASVTMRGKVSGYTPTSLVGDIQEGDCKVIIHTDELGAIAIPTVNDRIRVDGKEMAIKSVDGNTRRINGVVIGYELRCRG